jgi:hypothetical protein
MTSGGKSGWLDLSVWVGLVGRSVHALMGIIPDRKDGSGVGNCSPGIPRYYVAITKINTERLDALYSDGF